MITIIITFLVFIILIKKYNLRLDWIKESKMLLLYYNSNNSREYKVIFKF